MNPFWMIYGSGQRAPVVRHASYEQAKTEAKRLASNNPGVEFFVLASIAVAQKADVDYREISPAFDDRPF